MNDNVNRLSHPGCIPSCRIQYPSRSISSSSSVPARPPDSKPTGNVSSSTAARPLLIYILISIQPNLISSCHAMVIPMPMLSSPPVSYKKKTRATTTTMQTNFFVIWWLVSPGVVGSHLFLLCGFSFLFLSGFHSLLFLRQSLDGAGRNHLLPQVVLVLRDPAIPSADGLVLAHHDVLGDFVEQSGGRGRVRRWITFCGKGEDGGVKGNGK